MNSQLKAVAVTLAYFGAIVLGALFGSLCDRIFFPDEVKKLLFEAGWNILQVLTAFVFFLFGIKLFELFQVTGKQEAVTKNLEALSEATVQVSKAASELAVARHELRHGNIQAANAIATDVCDNLRNSRDQFTGNHNLLALIDRELFVALDVRAECLFDLEAEQSLHVVAQELLDIDRDSWRGNHWKGLAYLHQIKKNSDQAFWPSYSRDAARYFAKSTEKPRQGDRDVLNLSECLIVDGQFAEAKDYARRFIMPTTIDECEPAHKGEILALFFWHFSEFVMTSDTAYLEKFRRKFGQAKAKIRPESFYDGRVIRAVMLRALSPVDPANPDGPVQGLVDLKDKANLKALRDVVDEFCAWAES